MDREDKKSFGVPEPDGTNPVRTEGWEKKKTDECVSHSRRCLQLFLKKNRSKFQSDVRPSSEPRSRVHPRLALSERLFLLFLLLTITFFFLTFN